MPPAVPARVPIVILRSGVPWSREHTDRYYTQPQLQLALIDLKGTGSDGWIVMNSQRTCMCLHNIQRQVVAAHPHAWIS